MIMSEVQACFLFLFTLVFLSQLNCFQTKTFSNTNTSFQTNDNITTLSLAIENKCSHGSNNSECLIHLTNASGKRDVPARHDADGSLSDFVEPVSDYHEYLDFDGDKVTRRKSSPYSQFQYSYYRPNQGRNNYTGYIHFPQRQTTTLKASYKFDNWHTYNSTYDNIQRQKYNSRPSGRYSSTTMYSPKPSSYRNQYTSKPYNSARPKPYFSTPRYSPPSQARYTTRRQKYTRPTTYRSKFYADYFDYTYTTSPYQKSDYSTQPEYIEPQTAYPAAAQTFNSHIESEEIYETSVDKIDYGCICVPYYLCDNDKIITDGAGLLSPRLGKTIYKEAQIVRDPINYLLMMSLSDGLFFCNSRKRRTYRQNVDLIKFAVLNRRPKRKNHTLIDAEFVIRVVLILVYYLVLTKAKARSENGLGKFVNILFSKYFFLCFSFFFLFSSSTTLTSGCHC